MKLTHISMEAGNGAISVRWMKPSTPENGPEPHRAIIPCGEDIDAQLNAVANDLQVKAAGGTVSEDHVAQIKAVAAIAWTPELLSAAAERKRLAHEEYLAELAKREAAAKAQAEAKALAEQEAAARFQAAVDAAVQTAMKRP